MCLGEIGEVEHTWDEGGVPMGSIAGDAVCLMYTPGASVGDAVMVHLGYAVEILDKNRAAEAITLRRRLEVAAFGKENA
ncbi:MAG: HypC/HybG/HupF family hydrogenase formation chaperone [Acidimicrobiia bacterium]|jgi:hydrogenase maturation factor